jgi:uncharacterized membrane protein (UPF0127 family)
MVGMELNMNVKNRRTGAIVIDHLEIADTFYKRFKGLMGRKNLSKLTGLKIDPCNSIHCFFMRIPIDVIFLSKDDVVVKTIHDMKPWRVSPIVKGARYVIEANALELVGKVELGDKLEFVED